MIPYASWPGGLYNRRKLREADWHLLTSPIILKKNGWRAPRWDNGTQAPYALDNGAWTYYRKGIPFDDAAFMRGLDATGEEAEWIVIPDIVGGGLRSLDMSLGWLDRVTPYGLALIAVQDGMTPADVEPHLSEGVGIAIGGTTEWKLGTAQQWGDLAKKVGCYLHMLRVNSAKRIRLCHHIGAASFDGTSATKFITTLPLLDRAARAIYLF
jgi:hypothetical protein